jgi:hypothetical protein
MRSAATLFSAIALSLSMVVPAQGASNNAGSWIGAFVGALLGEIVGHHFVLLSDQRTHDRLEWERRTEEDEMSLKGIATALEEYSVDHNGQFPVTLDALKPLYYPRPLWIPESDPPAEYKYENPAARPNWGKWDIVDNGAFDPTLNKLRTDDGSLCTNSTCKYIIYAESLGLIGEPSDNRSTKP